ncbi:MAG: hypothetical protein NUV72_07175 [Bauldia sp.]|nr:hypothetical protein [Bauldia sp.]
MLKPLLDFAVAFGIKLPDRDGLIAIYLEAVRLPADLLREAVDRAVRSWKWGNRLPMPAELVGMVEPEMLERHHDLFTLTALAGKFYRIPANAGGFRVASLGAKFSVLKDLGQDEYDKRILEIRAALARGENIALWSGRGAA